MNRAHATMPAAGRTLRHALWIAAALLAVTAAAPAQAQDTGDATTATTVTNDEGEIEVFVDQYERVPIAVADARPGDASGDAIGQDIAKILRRDFHISGAFEVLEPATFLPGLASEGLAAAETNYSDWYSSGAEAVVKAAYKTDGDKLILDFRLYDPVKAKEVRLSWEQPGATPQSYRAATHAFANAVIAYYTGQPGFFGQEMLVVRKGKGESHVYRIATDGESLTKVSSGSGINVLPAWGPSGSVLFTSYDGGNPDLVQGGGERKTLSSRSGLNTGADYCAGNGKIALTLSQDDNPEVYVMSADGSGLTRLTSNGYIDTSPTWSPDCSKIAFVSNRGGSPQIYVMGADGSGTRLVTTAGTYNTSPAWSPTGGKIAFTARDEYNVFDIFTVDADSGAMERLTQDQGHNEEPTWSPDGRFLAFTSTRDGGSRLYIMTADGRFQTSITEGGGFETPAWSR